MRTATKFFKRAAKWYFTKAAETYAMTPTGSMPIKR